MTRVSQSGSREALVKSLSKLSEAAEGDLAVAVTYEERAKIATPERLAEIREQVEKLREYRLMVVDLLDSRDALVEALQVMLERHDEARGCDADDECQICQQARAALRDAGEPE